MVDGERYGEDDLIVAIDAGAEDIVLDDDVYEVITAPGELTVVRDALSSAGIEIESADVTQRPKSRVPLSEDDAAKRHGNSSTRSRSPMTSELCTQITTSTPRSSS